MKIRKGPTIFLVLVIVILMVVGVYVNRRSLFDNRGRSPGVKQSEQVENVQSKPNLLTSANNPPAQDPPNIESNDELRDYDPKKTLPRREYGKPNPFAQLKVARPKEATQRNSEKEILRDEAEEMHSSIEVKVTAIFGDTAIVEVDGDSKPVKAGESVAGLKVLKTGEGEVVLLGKQEYTIKLRGEPFRVPTGEAK